MIAVCGCGNSDDGSDEIIIELETRAGASVFELLKETHQIVYDSSSMGVFIESIDGIVNEGDKYWIYYVNGQPATTACDKYVVKSDDSIVWIYR
jgi:hypothetical protein